MQFRTLTLTISLAALAVGCQTGECPSGMFDGVACRSVLDASPDGSACVPGTPCSPPEDPCASGVSECEGNVRHCRVTGRLPEGAACGEGQACAADGTCSVCLEGAVCNTGDPCASGRVDCGSGAPVCVRDRSLTGTPCGRSGICGDGVCSECVADSVCNTGNPCTTGRATCPDPTTTVCEEEATLPSGVRCGSGLACGGGGSCSVCAPGAVCNTGNPCVTGRTDCGSGMPVCVSHEDVPRSTECGARGVCAAGECSECLAGTVCNTGNPCVTGVVSCEGGLTRCIEGLALPPGVRCGTGLACDGVGSCSTCVDGERCVTEACQQGVTVCMGGAPVCATSGPAPDGAVCRAARDACDAPERCSGGTCPADAPAPEDTPCPGLGLCDGGGTCAPSCVPDAPCVGMQPCERGSTRCPEGVCDRTTPAPAGELCRAASGPCFADASCDGTSFGCPANAPRAEGSACPGGVCDGAGTCVSCTSGATCDPGIECRTGAIRCSGGSPVCTESGLAAVGTACAGGVCDASGACVPCAEGAPCATARACERGEIRCAGGPTCTPVGALAAGVTCRPSIGPCSLDAVCDGASLDCPASPSAALGTTCPGGVCGPGGTCVACAPGAGCDSGIECRTGTVDCSGGAPACRATGNAAAGVPCAGGVCDGSGSCVACAPGASCDPPNPCQTGTLDCGSGSPVCTVSGNRAAGAACAGGVCDGAGICTPCTSGASCDPGGVCRAGATDCSGGAPACVDRGAAAPGTVCAGGVCDAGGACVPCVGGSACTPANPCRVGVLDCSGGTPACVETGSVANGTSCPGPACAVNQCASGTCDTSPVCAGTATSCGCSSCTNCTSLSGWYDVGGTYACCSGSSSCTCQDRELRSYTCSGTSCTYTVTGSDTQQTGCTACSDGNACTLDQCSAGSCGFPPVASGTPCPGGSCNASGSCVLTPPTCGPANGGSTVDAPSSGLCGFGTPSGVSGSGPFSWICSANGQDVACSSNRSCVGTVAWSVGCSALAAGEAMHGNTVDFVDDDAPTIGSNAFVCLQGVWSPLGEGSCLDLDSVCPPDSGGGPTSWFSRTQSIGSDGYWYCLENSGSTEFGTCENDDWSMTRLTGPAADCWRTSQTGQCCPWPEYPSGVCYDDCSASGAIDLCALTGCTGVP